MSIARINRRFTQALKKAVAIWHEAPERSFVQRAAYLSRRMLASARWRSRVLWSRFSPVPGSRSDRFLKRIYHLPSSAPSLARSSLRSGYRFLYNLSTKSIYPLNYVLSILRRSVKYPNSVLHISYMVHIPYYTVRILRRQNLKADYLAVGGQSPWWDKYDFHFPLSWPPTPWAEFFFSGRWWQNMKSSILTSASCFLPPAGSCPI
jgi:hypothetical protein